MLTELPPPPQAEPGPLTAISLANTIAASLPEHAIVVDEANTSGFALPTALAHAPRHTLLTLTGGSNRPGPARPRPVRRSRPRTGRCYPWKPTAARSPRSRRCGRRLASGSNVTTVLIDNAAYAILRHGTGPHRRRTGGAQPRLADA